MNLEEYNVRLKILLEQNVISAKAHDLAFLAFKELLGELNREDIEQAEMLFTHLPMALERSTEGKVVEGPSPEIMKEIFQSEQFPIAKAQVEFIETNWGKPIPEEEKNYLYMHYTTVLNLNH
ncbi:PRD domain-containing protein [Robertmurraya sp. DFI.2.37]|jgi:transcriptional antiterminator|uniref:PRD domain-containing protein n=1 Tax=Robertmurraya sp. DFI.2.37 TaxID=3031819 RepID=UPI0023DAC7F4|nr:PRD domain-containing protein [Robertmurraya sp. DFI.2.37]MDF1510040.1 PRD domain-containing protein [Robertmurraya sp. DFI.2.37]